MNSKLAQLRKIAVKELSASAAPAGDLYLFLPRNDRLVRLRYAGEPLGEALYRELCARQDVEVWQAPAAGAIELGHSLLEKLHSLPGPEAAAELRQAVNQRCGVAANAHPLLAEVISFRSGQAPDAHSIFVGSLSGALAMAAGHEDPTLLGELLIAATFHDAALPISENDHGAGAAALLEESTTPLPSSVREALLRHHEPGPHANPVLRFLSLAERFTEFHRENAAAGSPYESFARTLAPDDAALFRRAAP